MVKQVFRRVAAYGGENRLGGHGETFWGDGIVLYLNRDLVSEYNYQNSVSANSRFVPFILCQPVSKMALVVPVPWYSHPCIVLSNSRRTS